MNHTALEPRTNGEAEDQPVPTSHISAVIMERQGALAVPSLVWSLMEQEAGKRTKVRAAQVNRGGGGGSGLFPVRNG